MQELFLSLEVQTIFYLKGKKKNFFFCIVEFSIMIGQKLINILQQKVWQYFQLQGKLQAYMNVFAVIH